MQTPLSDPDLVVAPSIPSMVYISIVTYNSLADLPSLFDGIVAQNYPSIMISVWDNASTDGTLAWLAEHHPLVKVFPSRVNLGFGKGHNQVLRYVLHESNPAMTANDYFLVLNPDVTLDPNCLTELVQGQRETRADWVTGKLRQNDTMLYSAGHGLYRSGYAINIGYRLPDSPDIREFSKRREVFGASGACVLYTRHLIDTVSRNGEFFDEVMFMYAEDVDLDWRARLHGLACWFIPTATAHHKGSEASHALQLEAIANRYLSAIKNSLGSDLPQIMAIALIHSLARLILSTGRDAAMLRKIIRATPKMLSRRQRLAISRGSMHRWFAWSRLQPTAQPRTLIERLKTFFKNR